MKASKAGSIKILDKALDLQTGSELNLAFETELERDTLFSDLEQRRLLIINEDKLLKYEQIIIDKTTLNGHPNIILRKLNILSANIRKADGSTEEITF